MTKQLVIDIDYSKCRIAKAVQLGMVCLETKQLIKIGEPYLFYIPLKACFSQTSTFYLQFIRIKRSSEY